MKFRYGIEHEFSVIDSAGQFKDFSNTTYDELGRVIETLPSYPSDRAYLRAGSLGVRTKRWYLEGFDRFDDRGNFIRRDVKGFEIRTPVYGTIDDAVRTLENDFDLWKRAAAAYGYKAAIVSFNPGKSRFIPHPKINAWEKSYMAHFHEEAIYKHMLTYGPDINISLSDLNAAQLVDIGRKLTYYSPFMLPWSFSPPFYRGKLWNGLSRRTDYRVNFRPSVKIFLEASQARHFSENFVTAARVPSEEGRIEFKAFDALSDLSLYGALLALMCGLAIDGTLSGRAVVPDIKLHKLSARAGFTDDYIHTVAEDVLAAVEHSLPEEAWRLDPLVHMLDKKRSPANDMIDRYRVTNDIIRTITEE